MNNIYWCICATSNRKVQMLEIRKVDVDGRGTKKRMGRGASVALNNEA